MRLNSSDPDVETIISRIQKGEINLQPDFQRGEVWSDAKKRKLIDSILRNWHVPPIHVVELPGAGIPEVLDGQQRLVSIRDFVDGVIRVDGRTEPYDTEIAQLDGLTYNQLPPEWKRRFHRFSIRFFNISDYRSDEPAELFYRLNQSATLTSAEQRNAFFGPARKQVRGLVGALSTFGADQHFIGFSNSRMAYDDVIARFCTTLDEGTLTAKVSANTLVSRYRSLDGFSDDVVRRAEDAIRCLGLSRSSVTLPVRFNKATLFSWLCFVAEARSGNVQDLEPDRLGKYLSFFEQIRADRTSKGEYSEPFNARQITKQRELLSIYNDRATSRVLDVTSVMSRDIVIWVLFFYFLEDFRYPLPDDPRIGKILNVIADESGQDVVDRLLQLGWGAIS